MNLTGWYDGYQIPVRKGVYERLYDTQLGVRGYCYWNGEAWCCAFDTPALAAKKPRVTSLEQNMPWRGISKD